MVVRGYPGTTPVTMEDCIRLAQAVRRGAPNTFCIGDLPFMSCQLSDDETDDTSNANSGCNVVAFAPIPGVLLVPLYLLTRRGGNS